MRGKDREKAAKNSDWTVVQTHTIHIWLNSLRGFVCVCLDLCHVMHRNLTAQMYISKSYFAHSGYEHFAFFNVVSHLCCHIFNTQKAAWMVTYKADCFFKIWLWVMLFQ